MQLRGDHLHLIFLPHMGGGWVGGDNVESHRMAFDHSVGGFHKTSAGWGRWYWQEGTAKTVREEGEGRGPARREVYTEGGLGRRV